MIPVIPQPEPSDFDKNIRQKGYHYLSQNPNPTSKQWNTHAYWREILPELYHAYGGVCAYYGEWFPESSGAGAVEHYKPKSHYPHLAYEWHNYRLASDLVNARKGDFEDVLDPFEIHYGWFQLTFTQLIVKPAPTIDEKISHQILATIKRLKLNDEICIRSRLRWLSKYCDTQFPIPFEALEKDAPFIAYELQRQDLVEKIKTMWLMP